MLAAPTFLAPGSPGLPAPPAPSARPPKPDRRGDRRGDAAPAAGLAGPVLGGFSACVGAACGLAARPSRRRVARRSGAQQSDSQELYDALNGPRRAILVAGVTGFVGTVADASLRNSDETYNLFGTILPPSPYKETVRTELVKGKIWGFEQCIALASVSTNIRMTVVKLRDGKLWVSAPISPTRQCLRQLDELGEVAHLVVPSSALEHKASVSEFAKIYPKAEVWVTPGQAASTPFPLSIPGNAKVLGSGPSPPWADELECKVFFVEPPITDVFAEAAFFHKETRTLLVTDCALHLPDGAPKVLESYGYDGTPGPISPEQWRYKAIAFNFVTAREGKDEVDFAALAKPPAIVNPLLRFLVYRRCPQQAKAWVEDVAKWEFEQIVPAHLAAPFNCNSAQFLDSFGFLFGKKSSWEPVDEQLTFLRFLREQVGGPEF